MHVRRSPFFLLIFAASTLNALSALAQTTTPTYDPQKTLAPLTLPNPVNAYRSSNGAPGPAYWQNEADYELHANLDTTAKQLSATEVITYTNNSPDTLPSLWIQLDQNIYRKDARARELFAGMRPRRNAAAASANTPIPSTEGFEFDSVQIESGRQTTKADYIVNDTRMQIRLRGQR